MSLDGEFQNRGSCSKHDIVTLTSHDIVNRQCLMSYPIIPKLPLHFLLDQRKRLEKRKGVDGMKKVQRGQIIWN